MEENKDGSYDVFVKDICKLVEQLKSLCDLAVVEYTPLVDDLCMRKATSNEVENVLDYLFGFANDERILRLYKKVCRRYWNVYPDSIAFYIMEYKKEYDRESLIGTKYEYLLHEDDIECEDNETPITEEEYNKGKK